MRGFVLAPLLLMLAVSTAAAASYYTSRPDDPRAIYLTRERFGAAGDGLADDTTAVQQAVDTVQESTGEGIVFVPEGRYRVTRTINVWPGVRVIGYGARRPVFVLAARTPGFDDPARERYLVFFAGRRPPTPDAAPPDANPGTFYSAITNIDLEIGEGNPGAVGVRARYAQHCFTSHMEFRIGSGLAGIHEAGNVAEDVRFVGGEYGIWTGTPSPGWQFTMVDATFEGQRKAAIREHEAGLTLVRPTFRNVPAAIVIDDGHADDLFIKDGRMEAVSGPAVTIGLEDNPRMQLTIEHLVCRRVPVLVSFPQSGRTVTAPADIYEVTTLGHGLMYADIGARGAIDDVFDAHPLETMPAPVGSDLPPLPPVTEWANIRSLGARGDGVTDDTAAFQQALTSHRVVYVPTGRYIVRDTIALRPDAVLIGMHPSATQIVLPDRTPAFQGVGPPKALLDVPGGGSAILIGIGLYTNGINPRAVAARWMSGARSLMNDVRFLGGHGTTGLDGRRENPYNNTHTADPDASRRWDSQYPSLWVTNGGGGTFFDIWTPSTFAQAGLRVSDTSTPGRVYQMSSEHHVRNEVQLERVSNWDLYALQTEEERGESGFALPLEIEDSTNITIANFHVYRVISSTQPFPWAVTVANSKAIRFRNIHSYSNSKVAFDATVLDRTHGVEVRQREFAWLTISGDAPKHEAGVSPIRAERAIVEKLADGFHDVSGGAVDPSGDFYFVDAHWQRTYRWSVASRQLSIVSDAPLEPVNLAFDRAGNLLVVSSAGNGSVYSLKPGASPAAIATIQPEPARARPRAAAVLPVGDWRLEVDAKTGDPVRRAHHYVSPDSSTYISATAGFVEGATSWGVKSSDLIRAFGLAPARPGERVYLTSEAQVMTWSAAVGEDGSLSDLRVFANQGGEGVTTDADGNVYIAAGEVYVYTRDGALIDTIEVPERPLQVVFGGPDGHTLFMPARHGLYALRTRTRGSAPHTGKR